MPTVVYRAGYDAYLLRGAVTTLWYQQRTANSCSVPVRDATVWPDSLCGLIAVPPSLSYRAFDSCCISQAVRTHVRMLYGSTNGCGARSQSVYRPYVESYAKHEWGFFGITVQYTAVVRVVDTNITGGAQYIRPTAQTKKYVCIYRFSLKIFGPF